MEVKLKNGRDFKVDKILAYEPLQNMYRFAMGNKIIIINNSEILWILMDN